MAPKTKQIDAALCDHADAKHHAKGRCKKCYLDHRRNSRTPAQRERDLEWHRSHYLVVRNTKNARIRAVYGERAPEVRREFWLIQRYGLTLKDYDDLLAHQGGVCAICKRPPRAKIHKHLYVDHDHKTGVVRGLLCPGCNSAIGQFADDTATLHIAIEYLRKAETNG